MTHVPAWVAELARSWRGRADERLAFWANDPIGIAQRVLADELEAAASADGATVLTVVQAAVESGYSEAHLRDLAHQGTLPLVDGTGRMRIRRRDLPRKPGLGVAHAPLSANARALAERVTPGGSK